MSELLQRIAALPADKRAALARLLRSAEEPVAVIGMGCRLPGGASNPARYWELLCQGFDAVSEVPRERWDAAALYDPEPTARGKVTTRAGAFLHEPLDRFDPDFFGISPREAVSLDPQQRLLLEVTWEAIEDAGLTTSALAGSKTGVFTAIYHRDYFMLQFADPTAIDTYALTGTANALAPNRISYWLDLRGPSMAVDTACSSSLVALHEACRSLADGECRMAIVGGVNVMLAPEIQISLSRLHFMAPDGRCKAFDAAADGFGRGEGCGVMILKRLSDAQADGDRILALIRGTAVNQDGRGNGLTSPNGQAQREVIREALARAGVPARSIGSVEAHGTGTTLGDPIEMDALAEIYGPGEEPCAVGSVKTNIAHLEAAAGLAGTIKQVLCLWHESIAPQIHLNALNPHIDLAGTRIEIATAPRPWPRGAQPRRAAVSSFGVGGTNGHVILEEAPPVPDAGAGQAAGEGPFVLPISAHSADALRALAADYERLLRQPAQAVDLRDLVYSAAVRRSHHAHRLAVVGDTHAELADGLAAYLTGQAVGQLAGDGAVVGMAGSKGAGGVGLLCGERWTGTLRAGDLAALARRFPALAASLERSARALGMDARALWSELAQGADSRSSAVMLAVLDMALIDQWRAWGIELEATTGQGLGATMAAYAAGQATMDQVLAWARGHAADARGALHGPGADPQATTCALLLDVGAGRLPDEQVARVTGARDAAARHVSSLGEAQEPARSLLRALARLYVAGQPVAWAKLYTHGRLVSLPMYPWQRRRFWHQPSPDARPAFLTALQPAAAPGGHQSSGRNDAWEVHWRPFSPAAPASPPPGSWLILADRGGTAADIAAMLETRGQRCVTVQRDPGQSPDTALARAFEALAAEPQAPLRGVLFAWSLDRDGAGEPWQQGVAMLDQVRALIAHLIAHLTGRGARLCLLTRGAQVIREDDRSTLGQGSSTQTACLAQASIWGFARALAFEHPGLASACIDLPATRGTNDALHAVVELLLGAAGKEDRLVVRDGRVHVPRLCPHAHPTVEARPANAPAMAPDGSYLITGGLGGIGLAVARWLVDRGARHLILVAHRAPTAGNERAIEVLRAQGARVRVAMADVADARAMDGVIASTREAGPPLRGVFHCAALIDDGVITGLDRQRIERVLAVKAGGAWNLARATRDMPLDHFVLFSSVSALVGTGGQASYAAANAFLDLLALWQQASGRPGLSIAWGPWAEIGKATALLPRLAERGLHAMPVAQGVAALGTAMAGSAPYVVACALEPARWAAAVPGGYVPLLADMVQPAAASAGAAPGASAGATPNAMGGTAPGAVSRLTLRATLEAAPADERHALAVARLRRLVAEVMEEAEDEIADDMELIDLGVDSLMTLEMADWLEREMDFKIPAAEWLDSDIRGLASVIETRLAQAPEPGRSAEENAVAALSDSEVDAELAALLAKQESKS